MTVSTTVLSNFPFQGDLLDENGNITQQWRLFFQSMYTRIGGQTAPSNSSLGTSVNTNTDGITLVTAIANSNTTSIAGLTSTSNANATTVAGLKSTSNANATTVASLSATSLANTTTVANLTITTNNNTTAINNLTAVVNAAPGAVMPVTVGASPFTYKASKKGAVAVSGGVVQSIQLTRDGIAFYNVGLLDGIVALSTNDSVLVTFTTAPIMTFFPT